MEKYYSSYKCGRCGREVILITGEVNSTTAYGNYLVCPHCSSKKLIKTVETDDLKECMKHSAYERRGRALRQIRE